MTLRRAAAGIALTLTALVVQGAFVAPLASTTPVSLPAVLVASVAIVSGPSTGIALGFSAGLLADLASEHPAGVLALCWLGLGLVCGLAGDGIRTNRALAALAGALAAGFTLAAALLLAILGSYGTTVIDTIRQSGPTVCIDMIIALACVPVVRSMLHSPALRLRTVNRRG